MTEPVGPFWCPCHHEKHWGSKISDFPSLWMQQNASLFVKKARNRDANVNRGG